MSWSQFYWIFETVFFKISKICFFFWASTDIGLWHTIYIKIIDMPVFLWQRLYSENWKEYIYFSSESNGNNSNKNCSKLWTSLMVFNYLYIIHHLIILSFNLGYECAGFWFAVSSSISVSVDGGSFNRTLRNFVEPP